MKTVYFIKILSNLFMILYTFESNYFYFHKKKKKYLKYGYVLMYKKKMLHSHLPKIIRYYTFRFFNITYLNKFIDKCF